MVRLRPAFASALAFLLILVIGAAFVSLVERKRSDEQRRAVSEIGIGQAHLLERQLDRSLSATLALASILRQSGKIDNFDSLAAEIIKNYGGISNLQLAPNGVVAEISPLSGNEAAIGHDLLNDPRRRAEALKAIASRKLTLAGPFTLIQDGVAVIGRLPVFVPDELEGERFWGFAIALIRLPALLELTNLNHLVQQGYDYELARIEPDSGARVVFGRSAETNLRDPIPFEIAVPNGRWTLTVAPRGGWPSSAALPLEIVLVVLLSTLGAAFTYVFLRQPDILRREVELRTEELAQTIKFERLTSKLSAMFINLPAHEVDVKINIGLRLLGEFVGIDRCFLDQFSEDRATFRRTHLWSADGMKPEPGIFDMVVNEQLPWLTAKVLRGDEIVFSNINELPDEAVDEKAYCRSAGIKSSVIVPISASGSVIGDIGFDAIRAQRTWPDQLVQRLRLVGEIFANALVRKRAEASLQASREQYRSVVETAGSVIILLSPDHRILEWNHEAERVYGWQRHGVLGKDYLELCVPEAFRDAVAADMKRVLEGKPTRDFENPVWTRDGRKRILLWNVTRLLDSTGQIIGVIAIAQDITQRKATEDALREQTEYVRLLQKIAVAANEAFVIDEAMQVCIDEVCTLTGWPVGHAYVLAEDHTGELASRKIWRLDRPKQFETFRRVTENARFKPGMGLPGRVLLSGKPVWIIDVTKDPDFLRGDAAEEIGIKAGFAFPVLVGSDVLAVLEFFSPEAVEPDHRLLDIMSHVGTQLGRVIERRRLEKGILEASEREQRWIGQDLHDGLGQHLTGIAFLSGGLAQSLGAKSLPEADEAARITRLVNQSIIHTRDLARGLFPVHLESIGLVAALQELANHVTDLFKISCRFQYDDPILVHDNTQATHLYCIAREAVNNAIKHGKAEDVVIGLTTAKDRAILTVKDNGVGLPEAVDKTRGMGLNTMNHRARMIDASLTVRRHPAGGTIVTCSFQRNEITERRGNQL